MEPVHVQNLPTAVLATKPVFQAILVLIQKGESVIVMLPLLQQEEQLVTHLILRPQVMMAPWDLFS